MVSTYMDFMMKVPDDGTFLECLRRFPDFYVTRWFIIAMQEGFWATYAFHPVRSIVSLEHFTIHEVTNLMIRSANVESPVMFLSDNDSVVRDILSMGQDPGSRAVLHPIAVLISADLSVLFPVIPRPVMCLLLFRYKQLAQRGGKKDTNFFHGLLVMLH